MSEKDTQELNLEDLKPTENEEKNNPENNDTPPADGWFKQGQEGYDQKKTIDAVAKAKKERGVNRFWLGEGQEAVVVFVDSAPFFIYEHNIKVDGRWGNFITCTKEFEVCSVCSSGEKSTYVAYFTVINTKGFTRNDGTKVTHQKVLYPAKGSAILKLEDIIKREGSLNGIAFKIKRYSSNDPNCGTDFEKLGKVDLVKNFGNDANKPIDYRKILAPLSKAELASYGFGNFTVVGSENDTDDEDVNLQIL